jgi:hypothetical protein
MKPVFADTFFFLAVLNPADVAHARATELSRSLPRPRLTTDWILTEVGDAMSVGVLSSEWPDGVQHLGRWRRPGDLAVSHHSPGPPTPFA